MHLTPPATSVAGYASPPACDGWRRIREAKPKRLRIVHDSGQSGSSSSGKTAT